MCCSMTLVLIIVSAWINSMWVRYADLGCSLSGCPTPADGEDGGGDHCAV